MDDPSQGDDVCVFALDETEIRLESDSLYGWGPKGQPLYAEANGDHKGVNVIGVTEILKDYRPYYSVHPSSEGMKSHHVGRFVDKLMRINPDKEVWAILDNYRPHRSIAAEYEKKYQGRLHLIFLPPYSPELNPQENIWAWLKTTAPEAVRIRPTKNYPRGYVSSTCTPRTPRAR
ncbi:MAG: transposase [Firmicutes bacterium]|nr:transposase [Bacillota bacterium]